MIPDPAGSFATDLQRRVYEYVERNGSVTRDELARSITVDDGRATSKPARSGTYTESVPPTPDELRTCLEALQTEGHLTETDGELRVALAATTTDLDCEDGRVTIRPARGRDRAGIIETMRTVATDGPYVVADHVATDLERDRALVRANEDRSRVVFVAILEGDAADDEDGEEPSDSTDGDVVGWLHVDAPERRALRHTAEVTVGVDPDHRRQEIGTELLAYGLEWAVDAGYEKCYQHVPATNEGAIAFLEENGWEREGTHEGQYCLDGEYVDEIMLAVWP
ncbi:GCN5 family acetyltransferase [Natrinema saccharevitans]|uniref:GCN5 family acetyltransferase n=1 Tax=Natrinema saccharevitans TaxID=301967 RepID=A0A1S8B271_9EURY|nr:GNAT family N-acetyltransferase [Natrinema saccharevitans]OLZ42714.1 GCN5 family acetyltransferase [Natrinema saccharevitans]